MANNKNKLGKGLSAIFGDDIDQYLDDISNGESEVKGSSANIKIKDIRVNTYQPRRIFDDESLQELSESIKEHGVFTPILVRKSLKGYELVAGERRLRASKLANLTEIPAMVVDFDDKAMMEISLLENIQRENLSPIEEANAYNSLLNKLGYTQEQLAKRVSKSRTYITNNLRLLKLPKEIQEYINQGKLTYGHARALINIESEAKQIELAKRAIKECLTVRDIEKLANKQKPTNKQVNQKDKYLEEVRRIMEEKLQTKVDVKKNSITIKYKNNKDLNRILEAIDCLEKN